MYFYVEDVIKYIGYHYFYGKCVIQGFCSSTKTAKFRMASASCDSGESPNFKEECSISGVPL